MWVSDAASVPAVSLGPQFPSSGVAGSRNRPGCNELKAGDLVPGTSFSGFKVDSRLSGVML